MTQAGFRVMLTGALHSGAEPEQVIQGLANLFKTTPDKAQALLAGAPEVLREGLSQAQAQKLQQTLNSIGLLSTIETVVPTTSPGTTRASRYSLDEFVRMSSQKDQGQGVFELEGDRLLEINLKEDVWIKTGAMVAYRGDIRFERESLLEKGLGKMFKKAVSGEGARLTRASGTGSLYLADQGKKVVILQLNDEAIYVNGNDILALEMAIDWDINIMKKVTAMMAGGLFNVRLAGKGLVAITSHYDPLTLRVSPGKPVKTDPNATIAWSGSLQPELRTDVSFKTFLGRGSGESIQMVFDGEGFVVVQPFEEIYYQRQ